VTSASLDSQVVRARLRRLVECVGMPRRFQQEFGADSSTIWAGERGLQVCIQAVVDIASHMVVALGHRVPDAYRGQLLAMGEQGVLPEAVAGGLAPMGRPASATY
jgi:uncharacterized protein YutE (UPF0331/DUF86 family)